MLARGRIVRRDQAYRRRLVITGGAIKGEPGQLVWFLVSTEGGHNTSPIGSCNAQMFHQETVRRLSHLGTAPSAHAASPVMVITFGTAAARKIRSAHRKPVGGAGAAPCMGPSGVGHGLGGSPCPLTHGNKRHINDPSGRSDRETVKGLTISARPGRRTAAVASVRALRVSRLRLIDPIFER